MPLPPGRALLDSQEVRWPVWLIVLPLAMPHGPEVLQWRVSNCREDLQFWPVVMAAVPASLRLSKPGADGSSRWSTPTGRARTVWSASTVWVQPEALNVRSRRAALAPGDFVPYTGARPFRLELGSSHRHFVLSLDAGTGGRLARAGGAVTANAELPRSPSGRVLSAVLGEPAARAHGFGSLARRDTGEHVSAILRTLLREADGPGPASGTGPAGTPERIRRDLVDPSLAHLPAYVLAARRGLGEASHFSRVFRAEFGLSPRAVREQARARAER